MPTDPCPTCEGKREVPPFPFMPDDGPQIPCPDCAGPQPDTAPEGPWEADDGHCVYGPNHEEIMCFGPPGADQDEDMARRVAAALNGAPATPAERAVIDAAEKWATSTSGYPNPSMALDDIADAVARLRSERNQP